MFEKWISLEGERPEERGQGSIHVTLRWIHSKIKLFEQLLYMQEKNLEEYEQVKHDYMLKLDHMQLPFWWLEGENIKELAYTSNYTNTFI